MEQTEGLNLSFEVEASPKEGWKTRELLEQTVESNQQLLNCVKERETRSCAAAELFRSRYFNVLHELVPLEEEIKELNERHRTLVSALRKVQMNSASHPLNIYRGSEIGTTTSSTHNIDKDDAEVGYKQLLQRLSSASQLRDEMQAEVQRLQSTCTEALQEREALMRMVDHQQADLEPLVKDADNIARGVEMVRSALHTYGDYNRNKEVNNNGSMKKLLQSVVGWTAEEERALSRIITLMGRWNSDEDEKIKVTGYGRLQTIEEAVRFYQTWNNTMMDTISEVLREFDERREGLNARIKELKTYNTCHDTQ